MSKELIEKQRTYIGGSVGNATADLIESQEREIDELTFQNESFYAINEQNKELRAALSSLVGVTAIYAIRYDDDELDEALTRCKEVLGNV